MEFDALNYDEQVSQLETVARQAMNAWGFNDAILELRAYTNNAVFQVDDDANRYILRVHRPGHKNRRLIESERTWLDTLWNEAQLRVPEPLQDVVEGELKETNEPIYCDLLRWLDGEPLPLNRLNTVQIQAIGSFAARLHEVTFDPPEDFERPRLDWEGLFGQKSPYNTSEGERYFSDGQRHIIAQVGTRVQGAMESLGEAANVFGLIHGDLLPKNVLFAANESEKTLAVVDFNDCAWGYKLYDLAPMLWVSRADERYGEIGEALLEGYEQVSPLDEAHHQYLETFVAARHVASCRWIAQNAEHPTIRGRAAVIISERVEEMRNYLETGSLHAVKEV